eukprot:96111-Prorocentrum_minimum.AAC.1
MPTITCSSNRRRRSAHGLDRRFLNARKRFSCETPIIFLHADKESEAAERVGIPMEEAAAEEAAEDPGLSCCERRAAKGRHEVNFGIWSFVYQTRKPFHPLRLGGVLNNLQKVAPDALALMSAGAADEPDAKER